MKSLGARVPLDIAVLLDSRDERWTAMDLVGEMLIDQWRALPLEVAPTPLSISMPRVARLAASTVTTTRSAALHALAFNADRALARYVGYPVKAFFARRRQRYFHVVDHSYAQLVHALPADRTGVYCHDTDAFRAINDKGDGPRSTLRRLLAKGLLRALRSAAVVFFSTHEVRRTIERQDWVDPSRLVHAPYGVAPEFDWRDASRDEADRVLEPLGGRPFVLHVGSEIPRKRLDVLFEVVARLRARHPELRLVQQGGTLSKEQRGQVARLDLGAALIQPPKVPRATLAGIYRRAAVVLVTSEAEGFGFPVIEALACGAAVVASDIPVLREVGADAALYAPVADVDAWTNVVDGVLRGTALPPPRDVRVARAGVFTWRGHARTILDAYRDIAMRHGRK